ncbi:2-polyprenyl-6-methoxyphenol hydroxylase [Halogranum amylolyticum]|uniref:2-polyprenyl-6-methoxyphenol hydroxylase n=1 Tax=Halogranum amylolyticum TaxID=660520 RepID=A0A1H8SNZ1_9EURY|nr:FAD-dependent monooxygenase [Halogranum amylolyticum]SEO80256.1 2-polyprenyl-6-methoxyphenol hydroxylase [Halogranum amylolyticum]
MTDSVTSETEVLIVGSGPTGLTTAIELRRHGVDCRLIEKEDSSVETSRALAIQPRTLQAFEDMGVLDEVLEEGVRVTDATAYDDDESLFHLDMDNVRPPSPYPFIWFLPQNHTEQILGHRLNELGGEIEFDRELVGFGQWDDRVAATVRHREDGKEQTEEITANWLIGSDGAHSHVRETLGLELEGVTTEQEVLVADAKADWKLPNTEASIWFHEEGVVAVLPMPGEDLWRLFIDVTPIPQAERPDATIDVLQRLLRERTIHRNVTLQDAPWTSNFVANQRMVSRYRSGRVFLAGDSAHIHNPLGGLGMNLGIQDAYNLGWKLALVCGGDASDALLDTYEEERKPIAKTVLDKTGASGSVLVTANPLVKTIRNTALPRVLRSSRIQARILRAMTQLDDTYRGSSLAAVHVDSPLAGLLNSTVEREVRDLLEDSWRAPKAGERVLDGSCRYLNGTETSLYDEIHEQTGFVLLLFAGDGTAEVDSMVHLAEELTDFGGLELHQYVVISDDERDVSESPVVSVLVDEDGQLHSQYDAHVPTLYLVRPDDYVGFRSQPPHAASLTAYLSNRLHVGDDDREVDLR